MNYREPGIAPDVTIAAFGEWVFRVDPRTGQRLWYQHLPGGVANGIVRVVIAGDRVVVSAQKSILCVMLDSGQPVWSVEAPMWINALAVVEGMVIAGGSGEIAAYDLAIGALRWHDPFKNLGTAPVTIAGGGLVSGPIPHGKGVA